ncbi:hypothetical protein WR25_15701 [Diploscapter pachys]|uniref:Carboxylic ester hydrolase n=1 Tax=Diploscapter pachys TaxID=2018661 RepID=A0A2A2J445_9BILA|nr:hypothetical protein WR25_15701 [Diploscapter pachys]
MLVNTQPNKGPIIGKLLTSYDNEQAYTFLGIPLAKPTVGKLRFIRPQPVDPWKKPIYTTEFRNACMADAALTYKKLADGPVSEDCLYMNVYASHHCLHLASIFGFINLPYGSETPLFERNPAIRDLHFEFEWAQNEIRNFGGDPSKVTVYGHSAGAQIVKIVESNTYATIKIAKLLGCINANATVTSKDNERIIDCMIIKSSQELVAAQNKLDYYVEDIWGPYVDGEMIPDQYTTLRSRMKKRNLLIGTVLHEMKSTEPIVDKRTGHVIENRLQEICHDLAYLYNVKDPLTAEAACIAYYSIGNKSAQINDDMQFYVETVNHANANLDPSKKIYVYSYIYSGAGLAYDKYNPFGKLSPAHSEDFTEEEAYQRFKNLIKFNEAELDVKGNILLYVAISLGILIFVFGLMKFVEYRKRRAYNPL